MQTPVQWFNIVLSFKINPMVESTQSEHPAKFTGQGTSLKHKGISSGRCCSMLVYLERIYGMPIDLNINVTEESALVYFFWVHYQSQGEWDLRVHSHSTVLCCPSTDCPQCCTFTNGQVASQRNFSLGENSWIITLGGFLSVLISVQKIKAIGNWESISGGCSSADGDCFAIAQRCPSDFGKQKTWMPKYLQHLSFFYLED